MRAGADLTQEKTLCVVLYPYITSSATAGQWRENELGVWLDAYGLLTLFPTAQGTSGTPPVSWWNGDGGPRSTDFVALEAGILACKRLVPAIRQVAVVAYSQGGPTAVGLTQLRPGLVNRLLVIGSQGNPAVARYVEARDAGKRATFDPPVPTVFIAAKKDDYAYFPSRTAAAWMAKAHGDTNEPVRLPDRMDFHDSAPGLDATGWSYGPHVRFFETDAPNHDVSLYFTDPTFDLLYRDFVRDGHLPGDP